MSRNGTLKPGTLITNGHGAVFKITGRDEHADNEGLDYSGYFAIVVDGGKTSGEGKAAYLDDRDFGPDALRPLIDGHDVP
jgi:hypothetical protein